MLYPGPKINHAFPPGDRQHDIPSTQPPSIAEQHSQFPIPEGFIIKTKVMYQNALYLETKIFSLITIIIYIITSYVLQVQEQIRQVYVAAYPHAYNNC